MKPWRHQVVHLPNNMCHLQMTKYKNSGDFIVRKVGNDEINLQDYWTRHVFFGNWSIQFPGGDKEVVLDNAIVFPQRNYYCPNGFKWVATKDNSYYYCIVPNKNVQVDWEEITIEAGKKKNIQKRTIVFVIGHNWTLDGEQKNKNEVIACELNGCTIEAIEDTKLIIFTSRKVQ